MSRNAEAGGVQVTRVDMGAEGGAWAGTQASLFLPTPGFGCESVNVKPTPGGVWTL